MKPSGYDPDVLGPGLDVVFCGINPASSAAADGHNFSNASNRFWAVLHLAGFTDGRLRAEDERQLLTHGCGITAVVSRPTPTAAEVGAEEFRDARPAFEAKIRRYQPRAVAFLGKRALSAMLSTRDVAWGRQPVDFAGATAWVLPNPSGLNRGFSLDALVRAYAELRTAVPRR
ncbi:G/U mismatch-specific DNA glycosylase [Mycobacterium sp. AT1]|uniref:G/U mismatch-specific DNA glycosylase n=1 Tax=Mycobacterium sp. AT1 TaxID=1961706 RepID=UPI0009AC03AF|nr:G/U mismatch-specific DNA glycosylase [Mycobacterium sp. AT1]OPX08004.1 double-stranded uracil-DNA glycosylase [Mycobacterium sp. AT1]